MASLRDIRTRIRSVKSTQKITRAMKLVSAAKLRRAQERVVAARPYADRVATTVAALAKRAELLGEAPHPLLSNRDATGGRIEVIVVTSDRGLCGGFNSNTIRRANRFAFDNKSKYSDIRMSTMGRKGLEALRHDHEIRHDYTGITSKFTFEQASSVANEYCSKFIEGELDGVFILYNEFHSAIRQDLIVKQLLPIVPEDTTEALVDYEYMAGNMDSGAQNELDARLNAEGTGAHVDVTNATQRLALLDALLPQHFATELYRALVESSASEHGARMNAMENATKNASDVVDRLTLQYNRARQAAITTELMEIIAGSEALK